MSGRNTRTRLLSTVLALLTLLSSASCGKGEEESKGPGGEIGASSDGAQSESGSESESDTETESKRQAPECAGESFGGADYRVVYRSGAPAYNCRDIVSDGINGEAVNDAVYNRNLALEDKIGITLAVSESSSPANFVQRDIKSGGQEFDTVLECMNQLYPLALSGCLLDWNTLPYFDVSAPWWDQNGASEMSLARKIFMMTGDITMKTSGCVRFLNFNKDIWDRYSLPDPYAIVDEGKWTIDEFGSIVSKVSEDLDGNGVLDGHDLWGLLADPPEYLLSGCGVLYTSKDENDMPYIDCINEHTVTALEKVKAVLSDAEHVTDYTSFAKGMDTSSYPHIFDYARSRFAAGQMLVIGNCADDIRQLAGMEDRYGILPTPKLDENQSEYYHLIDANAPMWGFSSNQKDVKLASAATEMWAYLSDDLVEAFYEVTMKKKRADAPEDARMLDLVRSSVRYEITYVVDVGIGSVITKAYESGNLMSTYQKQQKLITKKLAGIEKKLAPSAE